LRLAPAFRAIFFLLFAMGQQPASTDFSADAMIEASSG
jgi:hypothetical protein